LSTKFVVVNITKKCEHLQTHSRQANWMPSLEQDGDVCMSNLYLNSLSTKSKRVSRFETLLLYAANSCNKRFIYHFSSRERESGGAAML
ncbi:MULTISPECIES: hypothetical protein, partial [Pseudomonadota]|uniref:hypothetical protein n=1 Tax=Pseudomonadota TaxID=1224 RepID=UPI00197BD26C